MSDAEMATPVAAPKKRMTHRKLTAKQQEEAVLLYRRGEMNVSQISARYGSSERAIYNLFQKRNVVKGDLADQVKFELAQASEEQAKARLLATIEKIANTKEGYYKAAELITKMSMNILVTCARSNVAPGTKTADLKALDIAAAAIGKTQRVAFNSLGIGTEAEQDEEMPILTIAEMTAEQVLELKTKRNVSELGDGELDGAINSLAASLEKNGIDS